MKDSSQAPDSWFGNERLTDMVLHRDDEPVIENGEIINEPEDVEENTIPGEQMLTRGGENNPCLFPIHFEYEGENYTADVYKAETLHAEYYVSAVTPVVDHLPEPFVVAEHFSKEKFDFPVNETYYPSSFGLAVLKAITRSYGDKTGVNKEAVSSF